MSRSKSLTLGEKADILAKADYSANGTYANQPYVVRHNGIYYKAYVREQADMVWLEVVRPAEVEERISLPSREPECVDQLINAPPSDTKRKKNDSPVNAEF